MVSFFFSIMAVRIDGMKKAKMNASKRTMAKMAGETTCLKNFFDPNFIDCFIGISMKIGQLFLNMSAFAKRFGETREDFYGN